MRTTKVPQNEQMEVGNFIKCLKVEVLISHGVEPCLLVEQLN
jgi:hypothetical protein